jgi:hypothetical protein
LSGNRPQEKIIAAELPDFSQLSLPYDLYNEQDIANRIIYVEASRGLSVHVRVLPVVTGHPVRQAPLEMFLQSLEQLLERGVTQFKFVDRTFNLNVNTSRAIPAVFPTAVPAGVIRPFRDDSRPIA